MLKYSTVHGYGIYFFCVNRIDIDTAHVQINISLSRIYQRTSKSFKSNLHNVNPFITQFKEFWSMQE